jgi:hypothetical protein
MRCWILLKLPDYAIAGMKHPEQAQESTLHSKGVLKFED